MKRNNSIGRVVTSFSHAMRGIRWVLQSEPNFRIHVLATTAVVVLGFSLSVKVGEWIALALAAGMVLMAETMNTAMEYLADALHPEDHPKIGKAKDAAAGAVMISAIVAASIGLIVFTPKLWKLLQTIPAQNG